MIKKLGVIVIVVMFSVVAALAVSVTVDDIIKLHQGGLSPDIIKSFIQNSGQYFELSPDDILKLKKAGVPEDIIKLMLETGKKSPPPPPANPPPQNNVVVPASPPQPTLGERLFGMVNPATGQRTIIEPDIPYKKKYTSFFNVAVYQKKLISSLKITRVGRYDPLRNAADRAGTMFLTEEAVLIYDEYGEKKYELPYKEITRVKVVNRYPDNVEARFHPLDRYQLRVEFEHAGKPHFMTVFTLPPPDRPDPYYGSVPDIANAIIELGKVINPRLTQVAK